MTTETLLDEEEHARVEELRWGYRSHLLDGLIQTFARGGGHQSLAALAAPFNTGASSLLRHFASREGIEDAVYLRVLSDLSQLNLAVELRDEAYEDRVRRYLGSLAGRMASVATALQLLEFVPAPQRFDERLRTFRSGVLLRLEQALQRTQGPVLLAGEERRLAWIAWPALCAIVRHYWERGGFPYGCLDPTIELLTELFTDFTNKRAPKPPRLPPGSRPPNEDVPF